MTKTRILLVDDHPVVRKGVAGILSDRGDCEICGQASTGREGIAAAAQLGPDVVIMDICMPDMNGLEATRRILKDRPQTEVLVLSMHESEQLVRDVLACGARGYVLKTDAGGELSAAVDALRKHKVYFTSRVAEVVLRGYLTTGSGSPVEVRTGSELSPREREIVQ
ncbi:MAG TPA: response regulator transcription factor, partial [Bryobacteraceae bacterium]